jgi:hypothetical protein
MVWELKTGKRRWSIDQLDFDVQPTAYGMAARALGHLMTRTLLRTDTSGTASRGSGSRRRHQPHVSRRTPS